MRKPKRTFKQNRIFTQNSPLSPRICPELAKEIGLSESILLLQYEFWIATEGEERGGQLWIRKTIREIKQVFSFWGTSTINRIINNLITDEYMIADALDEGDRKNGRWLRFGFDKLATLTSIKIICAETGQTICANLGGISPETAQDVTQNGTNNGSAPYREERDQEKKKSAHALLIKFHSDNLSGKMPNPEAQAAAAKWLLSNGYSVEQIQKCYKSLMAQEWRTTAVSLLTVKKEIGGNGWQKNGNGKSSAKAKTFEWQGRYYALGEIISDDGDRYTVMGGDGTPSKRWHTPEAYAADSGRDVEKVRAGWH